ncbi:MAG: hypothetical protein ACJA0X_001968 [Cyclobacteriaceae bacterium]|jgi:hypothetical protein
MAAQITCSTVGVSFLPKSLFLQPNRISTCNKDNSLSLRSKILFISANSGFLHQSDRSKFNNKPLKNFKDTLSIKTS